MSLEANTGKIADLVVTNPTATDPVSQGDDHIRLLKNAVFLDAVTVTKLNGQVWQQPARVIGTTYTNGTTLPITVNFSGSINAINFRFSLSVNGAGVAFSSVSTVANQVLTLHGLVIPAGATYVINQNGGTPALDSWTELR